VRWLTLLCEMAMKGEFDLIETYFAPLASAEPGSLSLKDDAAVLSTNQGMSTVVTTDCLVAGVHFFPDDPPETIALKLLAVNFSDLASMGAMPRHYTIAAALPRSVEEPWVAQFAKGLREGQSRFGAVLVGGDTVSTDGPLTLTLTALGEVPKSEALMRSGARSGDEVFVSGSIGDAFAGLKVLSGQFQDLRRKERETLIARYRTPTPRIALGLALRGIASAVVDISDGLVADLSHLCDASRVGAKIDSDKVPLSDSIRSLVESSQIALSDVLSGGDDYELLFSISSSKINSLEKVLKDGEVKVSHIGSLTKSTDVEFRDGNDLLDFDRTGYQHF